MKSKKLQPGQFAQKKFFLKEFTLTLSSIRMKLFFREKTKNELSFSETENDNFILK